MKTPRLVRKYAQENFGGVSHTTFNPKGPGVVRIHLVPPKYEEGNVGPAVAIINGQDIIPVNSSWTILLNEYIKEVNKYHGMEVDDADVQSILKNTCKKVKKVFPFVRKKRLVNDLYVMMRTFKQVAYREKVDEKWYCNQKCIHCYAAGQTNAEEKELSTDDWKKIIDKCRQVGIPQITFTGGEPTMREDLVEQIEKLKETNL